MARHWQNGCYILSNIRNITLITRQHVRNSVCQLVERFSQFGCVERADVRNMADFISTVMRIQPEILACCVGMHLGDACLLSNVFVDYGPVKTFMGKNPP